MALVPKFVVSRNPEWYSEDGHGEAYACLDSRGLFEAVRDMMVDWARRLPAEEKRCRPQVVYKKIREEVIKEAEALRPETLSVAVAGPHGPSGGLREARLVYFRRSSKVLDGSATSSPPPPRKDQENMRELYASTTLGFYRAPKRSCVKGQRRADELLERPSRTWVETRSSPGGNVPRHTAVRADGAHQALNPARGATACRDTWRARFQSHDDRGRELAIALMEGRIPSASLWQSSSTAPSRPAYHNKLKKLQPPGERQQSHDPSHSSSDSRAGEPGRASPEPRELGRDDAVASQGKGDPGISLDQKHVHSANERPLVERRRGAERGGVRLLRLDDLAEQSPPRILGEWVASNRGVVITPESGLEGSTQRSPTDRLDSLSTERWSEKALLAFPDKAGRRLSHAPRERNANASLATERFLRYA
ncbi:hypothetical protein Q5P01_000779 [Channa striata]|uniref:Uncharacterized protein n=1 Tax=Channa striata TaxID=64152 RepID=A0AA88IYR9_CHASR|nr:hypothetical protein Q5P01_000779 [Channa striata]